MSLAIAFKGPEGIVLAADSRVTLTAQVQEAGEVYFLPSTFDNAIKLLSIPTQKHIGVVTYGAGSIGIDQPRTPHSYLPEFDEELQIAGTQRIAVESFADKLASFFQKLWKENMPSDYYGPPLSFLVGGFDEGVPYGRTFLVQIPNHSIPVEQQKNQFGITWGGQLEFTNRLIKGYDPQILDIAKQTLNLTTENIQLLETKFQSMEAKIPYQFLPLQDCVDMSIYLIRVTMELQQWLVGIRGVGGAIDVATITRTEGFQYCKQKRIVVDKQV